MSSTRDFLSVSYADLGEATTSGKKVPDPPGLKPDNLLKEFESARVDKTPAQKQAMMIKMKQSAAWDHATGQVKAVLPMGFMMYMSGSSLSMWNIMMTYQTLSTPIRNLLGARKEFERFADTSNKVETLLPTLIYSSIWLVVLAAALFKLDYVGMLPKQLLDWVAAIKPPVYQERSVLGVIIP